MTARGRVAGPPPIEVADDVTRISIQRDARTDLYNTFRVGGPADYLVRAGTHAEVALALAWAREQCQPVTIFGGGSNMLIGDRGIRGLSVIVRRPGTRAEEGLEILDDGVEVVVRVPAAAPSNWFGRTAAERGWADLAWLVGLPGNVGGAIVNNAGAHGGEITDRLVSFRTVDATGVQVERERAWLAPRYRWTRLKGASSGRENVLVDAVFRLSRGATSELVAEADAYAEYRHRTQPTGACAGSIFKNPPGTFSGLVIEQAGLKGTRVGGAVVSEKHANFIVNDGGATAADIVALMQVVQDAVRTHAGIELEPEIERTGDWG